MDVILNKTFVPCFYERMSILFLLGYPCCVKGGNLGVCLFVCFILLFGSLSKGRKACEW